MGAADSIVEIETTHSHMRHMIKTFYKCKSKSYKILLHTRF